MARASGRLSHCSIGGRECSFRSIKCVNKNCVETEIGDVDEAVVFGCSDPMGVRGFLAFFVEAVKVFEA